MRTTVFLVTVFALFGCKKITTDDVNRETALNVGKTLEAAINENVPSDHVGSLSITKSWKEGTIKIDGDFSGNVGNYTITLTDVTFEYSHKDGKKEWKSKFTHNGTLTAEQSGSIISATGNTYSVNGSVWLKKKEKKFSGSGNIEISLTGTVDGNNANVFGTRVTW